jgi:hypothetical protein
MSVLTLREVRCGRDHVATRCTLDDLQLEVVSEFKTRV